MSEPEIGFKIQGRLYPWIAFDDWKHKEIRAVRKVTGYNPRELLLGQASGSEINLAFATVAFWRGHPEIDEHQLVKFMDELTPADLDFEGAGVLDGEGDAGPPDESGSEPSESTGQSSDATPEPSSPEPSGEPSSESTASASGRRTASKS